MYKTLGVVWLAVVGTVVAVTQEELAQYVAQQQTASLGAGPAGPARRQPYLLQAQPKISIQPQPQQQIYQFQQPKAQPQYQAAPKYQTESEQQYYQSAIQQQPAPQQYYQPRPQQPPRKLIRPQAVQGLDQDQQEETFDPPQPYQFGFDIKDDEFTNYQNRKEQREGDKISGSYSVVDSDGYIRTVTYTADPLGGFKADVVREPTDIKIKIPQPQQENQQPLQYSSGARKQQTQQYLQAAAQPKQQYALSQHAGGQGQYQQPQYQQLQYQPQQYQH